MLATLGTGDKMILTPLYNEPNDYYDFALAFYITLDGTNKSLPLQAHGSSLYADWGDGSGSSLTTDVTTTHTYANAGDYIVKIRGYQVRPTDKKHPFINSGYYDYR